MPHTHQTAWRWSMDKWHGDEIENGQYDRTLKIVRAWWHRTGQRWPALRVLIQFIHPSKSSLLWFNEFLKTTFSAPNFSLNSASVASPPSSLTSEMHTLPYVIKPLFAALFKMFLLCPGSKETNSKSFSKTLCRAGHKADGISDLRFSKVNFSVGNTAWQRNVPAACFCKRWVFHWVGEQRLLSQDN